MAMAPDRRKSTGCLVAALVVPIVGLLAGGAQAVIDLVVF